MHQTTGMIITEAGLSGDNDKNVGDGIQEFSVIHPDGAQNAAEHAPESTSPTEAPVIEVLTTYRSACYRSADCLAQ